MKNTSRLGQIYQDVYELVAGKHPHQRPWHFQYTAIVDLHKHIKHLAPQIEGAVLDVGCGEKPYKHLLPRATNYVGIDIEEGPAVDFIVDPQEAFPFQDEVFDVVLAFEVLEHVENLNHFLNEIHRVLKKEGTIIISVPFLFNEHGAPGDFRRLTKHSANKLLHSSIQLKELKTFGGVGTTLSLLLLNWVEAAANGNKVTRLTKGALMPIWIVFSFLINIIGKSMDYLDKTDSFYHHVLMVFKKT